MRIVNRVSFVLDALRVLVWTDVRALPRLQACLGDGLTPASRRANLRWLRALGLATLFLPWVALALAWGSRELQWLQAPPWSSKLALFLGWLLAWAYGRGVLQWFREDAWVLAMYRLSGHDPRLIGLRSPSKVKGAVLRRWWAARRWAWAAALSLLAQTLLLAWLPQALRSIAPGLLVVCMAWMMGLVQRYNDLMAEVFELGLAARQTG